MTDAINWHPNGTPGPFKRDGTLVYALDETGNCNRFTARLEGGFMRRAEGHLAPSADRTTDIEVETNARMFAEGPAMVVALRAIAYLEPRTHVQDHWFSEARAILARIDGGAA